MLQINWQAATAKHRVSLLLLLLLLLLLMMMLLLLLAAGVKSQRRNVLRVSGTSCSS